MDGFKSLIKTTDGENLHWTTDMNTELPIKMATSGFSQDLKPETMSYVFMKAVADRGDNPAFRVMRDNKELVWTWNQAKRDAFAFAKAMIHLGVDERSAVNIMGFNSPEWAIAYFGSLLRNNVISGVYATNGAAACQYQAHHSEAQVIVVETLEHLKIYLGILDSLPAVKAIAVWGVDKIPEEL